MLYYNKTTSRALKELDTTLNGLSTSGVSRAKEKFGLNTITYKTVPLWQKLLEPLTDVFVIILFISALLSVFIGEYVDAFVIVIIIMINIGIDYFQKIKTERILKSLRNQAIQIVTVKRNMEFVKIKETELVPGDIVILSDGNKVPADIRVIESTALRVDESALTGESLPISKNEHALRGFKDIYEQTNMLFQGTFITSGTCIGVVCKIGNKTEFSKIAQLIDIEPEKNPIQKKITKLVAQIIIIVGAASVITFILLIVRGEPLAEALRFVLAMAVSAIPEGLPVTVSIILALGMRTMAKHKALVTNMRSLEVIGSVNVIATDKTGTLSKNKLIIKELWQAPFTNEKFSLKSCLVLSLNAGNGGDSDPLDAVIKNYTQNIAKPQLEQTATMPFAQSAMLSGSTYKTTSGYYTALKGSPERIISIADLTEEEREQSQFALNDLTSQGYRVIGLATFSSKKPIKDLNLAMKQKNIKLIGFVAIADELRPESKAAVKKVTNAGISVHMITGDHESTALTIGKSLAIATSKDQVLDSSRIDEASMDDSIKKYKVFSRIMPEDKFKILSLLKRDNIVAMTGDGVNDAPALSAAHVGIAMGDGSQIAKDASDIVLLNNNFKTVVTAIEEGRLIIDNIKRVIVYLLTTNTGEVLTLMGALIIGWPAPLMPIQILWVNIVTDTTMVIPLGVEPGEKNIMKRKPIPVNAPLLSRFLIGKMIMSALVIAITTLFIYGYFLNMHGQAYAQSAAFLTLVVTQWANAFSMRSHTEYAITRIFVKNKLFWAMLLTSILIQIAVLETPLGALLHITPLSYTDLASIAAIAFIIPIAVSELQKYIFKRHQIGH